MLLMVLSAASAQPTSLVPIVGWGALLWVPQGITGVTQQVGEGQGRLLRPGGGGDTQRRGPASYLSSENLQCPGASQTIGIFIYQRFAPQTLLPYLTPCRAREG